MLNGPPISVAIIAASTIERRILLVSPSEERNAERAELITPITGFIRHISKPIIRVPKRG